jgi:hypothetical protein
MTSSEDLINSLDPDEKFLLADGFDGALIFPAKCICSEPKGRELPGVRLPTALTDGRHQS